MPSSTNVLDHLADCANVYEDDFPGTVRRRKFHGAHASITMELVITTSDGDVFRVTADRVPKSAEAEVLKDAS